MKKLGLLILGIFFTTGLNAQMPGYNFIHSGEKDGYFRIQLTLPYNQKPLNIEDVFVINYPQKQQKHYRDILRTIQNFGGTVITKERFEKTHQHETMKRYVFLGSSHEDYLSFSIPKQNKLETFDTFLVTQLLPVYMKDVELRFGGNIYEVYPDKINFLHDNNNLIVGRFKKQMKTRLELRANTPEGYIITNTLLDFTNPIYTTDPEGDYLQELWEDAKQYHDQNTQEKLNHFFRWTNLFPLVLFLMGISIICFGLIMFGRRLKEESVLPDDFWDDAPETVIDDTDKEILEDDGLPFEVHLRKKE